MESRRTTQTAGETSGLWWHAPSLLWTDEVVNLAAARARVDELRSSLASVRVEIAARRRGADTPEARRELAILELRERHIDLEVARWGLAPNAAELVEARRRCRERREASDRAAEAAALAAAEAEAAEEMADEARQSMTAAERAIVDRLRAIAHQADALEQEVAELEASIAPQVAVAAEQWDGKGARCAHCGGEFSPPVVVGGSTYAAMSQRIVVRVDGRISCVPCAGPDAPRLLAEAHAAAEIERRCGRS